MAKARVLISKAGIISKKYKENYSYSKIIQQIQDTFGIDIWKTTE